jgi:hypothetical protein
MKLWLLESKREYDYDTYDSFVVRAESEQLARLFASGNAGDEGKHTWLDSEFSTCTELTIDGETGVILGSFNEG